MFHFNNNCIILNSFKKFIRTGKYKDRVFNYKEIFFEKKKKLEEKKEEKNEEDINILKLIHIEDFKICKPKKKSFNKKKIIDKEEEKKEWAPRIIGRKDDIKNEERNKHIKLNESNINKEKENYINVRTSHSYNFNKMNSRSTNKCDNYINNNYKNSKKNIIYLTNFTVTNSFINKKYYIIKKQKKNSDVEEDEFMLYEKRSLELLNKIKLRNEQNEDGNRIVSNIEKNELYENMNGSFNYIDNDNHSDKKVHLLNSLTFENKDKIIKKIYKSSINHVRDENLWKKYVQNVFIISSYLDCPDIVILFWCFSKIGYRDNRLVNLLCSIVLKKINELSPCAIALLLNSFKKLEIKKYDTIELLTNQFCFHLSNCTYQDIALVSNSLSFFYIYHKNYWKKCILKLQNNSYITCSLHLCLILSAFARLDIREGNILLSFSKVAKRLVPDMSPNNLALVIHSFAKLKFVHPKFFNYLFQHVHKYLDKQLQVIYKVEEKITEGSNNNNNNNINNNNINNNYDEDALYSKKNKIVIKHCDNNRSNVIINDNVQDKKELNKLHESLSGIKNVEEDEYLKNIMINNNYNAEENFKIIENKKKSNFNKEEKAKHTPVVEHDNKNEISESNNVNHNIKTNNSYINKCSKLNDNKKKMFDLQSLVLLLYSSTCLITCTEQMTLKLIYLIMPHKDHLGDHKIDKLKYVSDYIQNLFPSTFETFPKDVKDFFCYIDTYEIKKKKLKYSARWINELSRILTKMNVDHIRNVYINNICTDIMLTSTNVIIKCLGPYSYYINSLVTTSISDLKLKILESKKYKVINLSYHDWNKLNDYEEKIKFLYSFGRHAANIFFINNKQQSINEQRNNQSISKSQVNQNEKGVEHIDIKLKMDYPHNMKNQNIKSHSQSSIEFDEKIQMDENFSSDEEDEILNFLEKQKGTMDINRNDYNDDIEKIKNYLSFPGASNEHNA
ncbi:RAP protein, putative [Plasmodium reichenowi]|uniref:RAP protein, putative n=1 Tax=Plasmodium reichenowi TaxID=5854 RepID=A0A060RRK7_PLARE|nr:RAP protein, putative [Plasmodium reichenowi]